MTRWTRHRLPPPLRQGSRTPSSPCFAWAVKWPPRRMEDWSRYPLCGASARCVRADKLAGGQALMPACGGAHFGVWVTDHPYSCCSPSPPLVLPLLPTLPFFPFFAFAGDSQLPAQCRHVHGGSGEPCDGHWPACSKQRFVGGGDRRWARAGPLAATPDRAAHWRHQQHVLRTRGTAI